MLMRSMNEFKKYQYQCQGEGIKVLTRVVCAVKLFLLVQEETKVSMKVFEQSLGILLKCAFTAVEALQTLDLTNVVEHTAMVLKQAIENYVWCCSL